MKKQNLNQIFKLLLVLLIISTANSCSEEAAEGEELVGIWTGVSVDPDAPKDFEIRDNFTFQLPVAEEMSGTWVYHNIAKANCDNSIWDCTYESKCTGFLIYKNKIGSKYTFEEGLTSGTCVEGGLGEFEIVDENTIKYRFIFNRVVAREATLTRS